jgi:hypothetical protein
MTMRTPRRLGAVVGLAIPIGLVFFLVGPEALAASGPKVVQSNWYWYHAADNAAGSGLETLPEPSGVPSGDLSVAFTGGSILDATQPSKETYLAFDLSGIDPAATVTSFTFTVTLDGPAQVKSTPPVLIACAPVREWNNGSATPWAQKPIDDCSTAIAATGKFDTKTSSYSFAIPSLAQSWLGGVNTGVAIRHDPVKQKAPFQLNFTGPATVKSSLAYAAPATTTSLPSDTTANTPPASSTGSSTGSLGGTGSTPTLGTPGVTSPTVASPASPPPQIAPQAQPVVAVPHIGPASSMPSTGFWVLGAAVLGFLVLVSLVLGDTTVAPAAGPTGKPGRMSRLDQVLRARRTSLTLESR